MADYILHHRYYSHLEYNCRNYRNNRLLSTIKTYALKARKWNESGFRPPLWTYRLNWARRTSWGWWDKWDDTVLQTQDSKFESWRSEAEHATSRSRRLPTILTFTRGRGRNIFVSFKPPRPGTEPRTLAWKAAVLTTTLGPPPVTSQKPSKNKTLIQYCDAGPTLNKSRISVSCLLEEQTREPYDLSLHHYWRADNRSIPSLPPAWSSIVITVKAGQLFDVRDDQSRNRNKGRLLPWVILFVNIPVQFRLNFHPLDPEVMGFGSIIVILLPKEKANPQETKNQETKNHNIL